METTRRRTGMRWLTMARVGLRMMLHDKAKFAGALVGVVFAVGASCTADSAGASEILRVLAEYARRGQEALSRDGLTAADSSVPSSAPGAMYRPRRAAHPVLSRLRGIWRRRTNTQRQSATRPT